MIALRCDTRRGERYLADAPDGVGFLYVKCPTNASLWEDLSDLGAWLDTLGPDAIDHLDSREFAPVEVIIDWSGVPWRMASGDWDVPEMVARIVGAQSIKRAASREQRFLF